MRVSVLLAAVVIVPLMQIPWSAQAFECPAHFAEAQTAIDKASKQIERMEGGMPMAVLSHLRYARMSLVEAKYHHTQSVTVHHARAIVRANEARGHAVVGSILSRGPAKQ